MRPLLLLARSSESVVGSRHPQRRRRAAEALTGGNEQVRDARLPPESHEVASELATAQDW